MSKFFKIFSKYLLLILVAILFECVFSKLALSLVLNLVENILFAIVLICPLYCFGNNKLKSYYLNVSFVVFSVFLFVETAFYYLFKTIFTESAIFVAFDTNSEETKEFIGFYFDTPIIVLGISLLVVTLFLLTKLNKLSLQFPRIATKMSLLAFGIIILLKFSGLIIYNLPFMIARSAVGYHIESSKLGDYAKDKMGSFTNVERSIKIYGEEIYVVIVGESTARSHLGIYGYYRNTTPLLDAMKDELTIYNKVISPDTYTIASLTKVLTLGNYENPDAKYNGSIIQLLNQAGFKTYWISAQKPLGANDSYVTKIGMGASESYFLNIKNAKEKTLYDEVLVKKMHEVLQDKNDKKVVFLHTLGTHMNYKYRYPEHYNVFKDIPRSKFKKDVIYSQINAYDNAVRYTDYIVKSVIESVKSKNVTSAVLYFSDHGEEVYDDIEFSGHFRDMVRTKNVYEIPFVLWQSEKYKQNRNLFSNQDRKYMSDDLFHSMADLFCIKAKDVDSSRSIFSEHLRERTRIVFDTLDYDAYFKTGD
ncbi:sulfatase-like hydrolase/transferase [Neotamlana nanhaiensis]|nr:sulfatase-like hydrolase/transferase [Tamlana nanhaiensis]